MSRKIAIILIILVLIGIGGYLLMNKSPQSSNNQDAATSQNKSIAQKTLKSLLSSGKSQRCTYSSKLESTSINGVVYVANNKMRGDFTTISEQIKMNGHMIIDGGYSYIWSDSSNQGIKMAINQEQQVSVNSAANNQAPDINQPFDYTCQGWTQDNAVFNPPSNISFSLIEVPSNLPSDATPSVGTNNDMPPCSACDSIPEGAARNACKTQLNCK